MTGEAKPPQSTPARNSPQQKRILVRNIRAAGVGGRVQLWSLEDGWAVFPDWDAKHRFWIKVGLVGAALMLVVSVVVYKLFGGVGTAIGGIGVLVIGVSRFGDWRAVRWAKREKERLRIEAIHNAGGLDSIRWAVGTGGRNARTVAQLHIWFTAAGVSFPVVSANSVASATVWRQRRRAVASIELADGGTLDYRVRGQHAPDRLVTLISRPLGDKCVTQG